MQSAANLFLVRKKKTKNLLHRCIIGEDPKCYELKTNALHVNHILNVNVIYTNTQKLHNMFSYVLCCFLDTSLILVLLKTIKINKTRKRFLLYCDFSATLHNKNSKLQ